MKPIFISALFGLSLTLSACEGPPLEVRIQADDKNFYITNKTSVELGGCAINVNSRYNLRGFEIPTGKPKTILHSSLMSDHDVRLDARLDPVRQVFVMCSKPVSRSIAVGPTPKN